MIRITLAIFFVFSQTLLLAQFQPVQNFKMLALGDSYTIGTSVAFEERWPGQLVDSLEARGINSDTLVYIARVAWRTDQLLNAFRNHPNRDYDVVSLLIGVNNQFQGRSVNTFDLEFRLLLDSAINAAGGDTNRVFVVSIPDYAFTPFGQGWQDPIQTSIDIDTFNARKEFICREYNVEFIDITDISRQGLQDTTLVASDGLHPSGEQYTLWVARILPKILAEISQSLTLKENPLFYPNPSNGTLFFREDVESFEVLNSQGQRQGEGLRRGLYFIKMNLTDGSQRVRRLMIN